MKYFLCLFCTSVLLLTACQNTSQKQPANAGAHHRQGPPTTANDAGIKIDHSQLASIKDPFCKMDMSKYPITDTATVNGKTYPFCARYCKDAFLQNPAKYVDK